MLKSIWMRIMMIVGCLFTLVGVMFMCWMLSTEEERNVINVRLDEGATESLAFESLSLVPGDVCEYTVRLQKGGAASYELSLDFVEGEEKTLKHYARVTVLSGEEIVYDELLATAFDGEDIVLAVDFDENINTELKIVYYMPIEVGNEAKNAEAVFELQLTASNE